MKMFAMFLVLTFSLTAFGGSLKYHDRVKVKTGFYEGCTGVVDYEVPGGTSYAVYLENDRNGLRMIVNRDFEAKELEVTQ